MPETQSLLRVVRFGAFEADLRTGELRKNGIRLKFGGQPFQVLAILLERPGDVVTREELQNRLWPDTFVDVEHNLNTAVNKIREVLGDSADIPRFIETLPRRGYRFIGTVEPKTYSATPIKADPGPHAYKLAFKIAAGLLTIGVFAVCAFFVYQWLSPKPQPESAQLNAAPFTALLGEEESPALSPDGSRIAFAWNGDPPSGAKGFDLYVKAIGSETLLRLTQHPSEWISATWSPDATQIAFHRIAGADSGIYIVPALGGPERKIQSTHIPLPWAFTSGISWSSDGKWIAFSDVRQDNGLEGIYLISPETSQVTEIQRAPGCISEHTPAFTHKGDRLAYWCSRSFNNHALYSLSVQDGKPKFISVFRGFRRGLTWSADDQALIYSMSGTGYEWQLAEVNVANGLVKGLRLAGNVEFPTASPKGQLAFTAKSDRLNICRKDLLHLDSPPIELVPSTQRQHSPVYSPNGRQIAFASDRAGITGVWIGNEDGRNVVQISNPRDWSGSPDWSPDGKMIAFDSRPQDQWEINVADLAERTPRKLNTDVSNIYAPRWSRDGKWIYFVSAQAGVQRIYRCPSSGGQALLLSKDDFALRPQESLDGSTVYFMGGAEGLVLKKLELVQGVPGPEAVVDGFPTEGAAWTIAAGGIYFVPVKARKSLRFFDFSTRLVRPVFEAEKPFWGVLSLSPDGRWLIYSQLAEANSDIMLINDFR
jgi:Tol biopolymer transport system component/DNA-binding winged helix-turn-helix (wHTH) protein